MDFFDDLEYDYDFYNHYPEYFESNKTLFITSTIFYFLIFFYILCIRFRS